jgi:mannan endo-1,4-beta-mannosidase
LNNYSANSVGEAQECGFTGATLDEDLTAIGSGQEVMRAWFFQSLATTNGQRDWTSFDNTLAVARAHGVHVIFVLANQWGYCDGGTTRTLAWYQAGYKTQVDPGSLVPYRQWVAEVIARYAGNPTIAFWQLVNEGEARNPGGSCSEALAAQALRAFADDVGGLIRSRDLNHLIGLGTIASECGSDEADYQTVNASPAIDVCDYHDYGSATSAMPGDQYNGLQASINRCQALDKPIVVGEIGIHSTQVGGIAARAVLFNQKFATQFAAGVAGELLWDWSMSAPSGGDYEIGPGDPSLALLTKY